ncbi:TonB-linked SusC/RagA family outer membrane protein [Dyadobacter jejuensis]|uniref:TonB-linked SusC/RagA family outer membrane protein n=1 Tax=Dyadobacter jejuensis TaxID=1082580 RepID=A0A316AJQ3_9BACT|nr:TonB-dependent receptor [Dyadobacter jejuensis]PWJ57896.1 TonB-linked SusC/RagA family outer membrane protein [Dyadobacter jejuensis]
MMKRHLWTAPLWVLMLVLCLIPWDSKAQILAFSQQVNKEQPATVRKPLIGLLEQLKEYYKVEILFEAKTVEGIYSNSAGINKKQDLESNLKAALWPLGLNFKKINDHSYIIIKGQSQKSKRAEAPATGLQGGNPSPPVPDKVLQTITGQVLDEENLPLPGVSVVLKGTTIGTTTDSDGRFSIEVSNPGEVISFSFVGFKSQEVTVGSRTQLSVVLEPNLSVLDEIIVVGYGTKKKEEVTGAIAQVSGEALTSRPVTKVGQALQGLIPNLNVTNPDGNPNANPTFNVRGTTSLSGGSALVLVDGIQMDMNLLNPADIESITVLKDAASAAIYGARGAFGVILVTTKKGSVNKKAQISYSGSIQFNKPTYLPDLLSTTEFLESQNVAQFNVNGGQKYSDDQIKWVQDYIDDPINNPSYHILPNGKIFWNYPNNVIENMVQPWAPGHNHTVNVTGGNAKTSYYFSGAFLKQDGLFKTSTDVFKRYNFTSNVSSQITDWFKLGAKVNYAATGYDEPHKYPNKGSDWWEQMTRGEPQVLFPQFTPADSPVGAGIATENFANFLQSGSRKIDNATTGIYSVDAEVFPLKGLKVNANFSYTSKRQNIKENQVAFPYIRDTWIPQISGTSPSFVQRNFNSSDYFAGNIYADYGHVINNKHTFSALVGYNQEWFNGLGTVVKKQDLISSGVPVLNLATGLLTTDDSETSWAIRGVFARLNYDYMGKYLIEFNSRYDGTSRFPQGRRFGYFPSVSAGWRVSKERFMEPLQKILPELKLRASYGSLGNQLVSSNFPYISLFGINNQVPYILGDALPLGITAPGLVSPGLTWEKVSTLDFGADANLLGKLNLGFDWYKRTTSGMLVAGDKLPAVLGTDVPQRNGAELETTGFEFSIKWSDQLKNNLRYDVGVVLSNYKAIITRFDNNPNLLIGNNYVGRDVNEIWGFETVGIFQQSSDVASAANQDQLGNSGKWGAGDIQYKDLNGDNVISRGANTVTDPGDQKIIGNATPQYQFGITGNLEWKGVDLALLLQGVGKRDYIPTGNYFWGAINNGGAVGTKEVYRNSWTPERPDAYYPIYKSGSGYNIQAQTRYMQNSAYIRLKNIALGYSFPTKLTTPIGLNKARVYFSGQNLWEFTQLKGNFDPEVIGNGGLGIFYPLQRVVSFGIQLTF